ncbi:MAG: TIGR01458 family HAD-type hydrolase [Methyloceanibacter sp.]|jgi:HAD superfamily hydrolase (TIGR01458 family)|uniref:TIGR01458 family HAD-type hydrolase n=1 Tax=Methyloceanibacter sp. TaxID=1965321 RepID=UPI003C4E663D
MIRGILLDLAGVVYEGDHVLPNALEAVRQLHSTGLPIRFVTNTTTKTKKALLARLTGLGLEITSDELFTPGQAARAWLKQHNASPLLLVHPNLKAEFSSLPDRKKRAVIVGDAGEAFTYWTLNHAFRALIDGAAFLALAKNRTFMDDDGKLSLDAGAFVSALEYSSGKQAIVLGKPSPDFFHAALASMGCAPEEAVMVGDDAECDVAGALLAGLSRAVLVRTGKYRDGDERRVEAPPTAVVKDLPAAAAWILGHRDG